MVFSDAAETDPSRCAHQRKKIRRVKTACRTCKGRKIKCDEGKPSCCRCLRSGVECGGYGVWDYPTRSSLVASPTGSSSASYVEYHDQKTPLNDSQSSTYQQLPTKSLSPNPITPMNDVEKRYFEYFDRQALPKVCGVFKPNRDVLTVMQANLSEPLLMRSLLAFSAAYKSQNIGVDETYADFADTQLCINDQQYALRQYIKVLSGLRARLQTDKESVERLVPLLCLVLAIIELLQGGLAAVGTHIGIGLRTLTQLLGTSTTTMEVSTLGNAFRRMYLLSSAVSGSCSDLCLLAFDMSGLSGFYEIPHAFESTYAARDYLETIYALVLKLKEQCRTRRLTGSRYAQSMKEFRDSLERSLNDWDASFKRSLGALQSQEDHRTIHGIRILRVMQIMVSIMVSTVLSPESAFDAYTDQFRALLSHTVALWDSTGFSIGLLFEEKGQQSGARFIIHTGIVAPLYYTAIKCRVPSIRRQAISILELSRYREGLWSSASAAQAARAVMLLEEGDAFADVNFGEFPPGSGSVNIPPDKDDCNRITDKRRFYDVRVLAQNDAGTKGSVQCLRRCEGGLGDPVVDDWGSNL